MKRLVYTFTQTWIDILIQLCMYINIMYINIYKCMCIYIICMHVHGYMCSVSCAKTPQWSYKVLSKKTALSLSADVASRVTINNICIYIYIYIYIVYFEVCP